MIETVDLWYERSCWLSNDVLVQPIAAWCSLDVLSSVLCGYKKSVQWDVVGLWNDNYLLGIC